MGNYSTTRGVRTWRILAQLITCDICCFSQRAIHGIDSPCSSGCDAVRWAYAMPVRVLFVSSRSSIVFNPSAGLQSIGEGHRPVF